MRSTINLGIDSKDLISIVYNDTGVKIEMTIEFAKMLQKQLNEAFGAEKETYFDKLHNPTPTPYYPPNILTDKFGGDRGLQFPPYPTYPTITCSNHKNYLDMQ